MFRRILLRIGDYVFVTRPLILIPVWSFYILGMRAGRSSAPESAATAGFVCLTAVMVTAYLINQVFDQDTDRYNNKGHFLTRGILGVRTVVAMALVSFAVASLTYQNTTPAQRPVLAAGLVLSLVYSLPPIRLCARPLFDLVANAVGYGGIAYLSGYLALDRAFADGALASLPWVFLVGATFLHTTILDIDGDRATGKITTAVSLGARRSAVVALFLCVAGLGAAVLRNLGWLPVVLLGLSVPLFGAGAVAFLRRLGGRERLSSYTVQTATLLVTVAAAAVEPRYLVLVVPIVLASRVYYRERFGVSYPGSATGGSRR
ncbi:MAG: UbiA family prenyltransferase [Gemmatimonadales bacterium]|jgi:4-hydroxybenzoate polyprenyltransferase